MFPVSLEKASEKGNGFGGYDWNQSLEETLGSFQE